MRINLNYFLVKSITYYILSHPVQTYNLGYNMEGFQVVRLIMYDAGAAVVRIDWYAFK